jgi:hypothetical protein
MASTKPGQRKLQILQALAAMLEQPKGEKITTAALARKLESCPRRRCTAISPARRRCSRA